MSYTFGTSTAIPDSIVFHIDMNAYFASVEQACNPFIQGKPVAVAGSVDYPGSVILARSYQAKARGVKSFSKIRDAKAACPELIVVPIDHLKYYDVNQQIAKILNEYTPLIEIYSIDEFFLDMTNYFKLHPRSFEEVAAEIKSRIRSEVHECLTCSIGVGNNKLLAKVGSDYKKPDGLTIINWENRHFFLDDMDLADIWGIGWNCLPKLQTLGIFNTSQIREINVEALRGLVGSYWIRLKQIANGEYYDTVDEKRNTKPQKSMQHAHTLSKATKDEAELKTLIRKLSERLAVRLRRHGQSANKVTLGIRPSNQGKYGWGKAERHYGIYTLPCPSNSGWDIYIAACQIMDQLDIRDVEVRLAVVGVQDLAQAEQINLWDFEKNKRSQLETALDQINNKYGEFTMRSGDILRQRAKERELNVNRMPMTFHPD